MAVPRAHVRETLVQQLASGALQPVPSATVNVYNTGTKDQQVQALAARVQEQAAEIEALKKPPIVVQPEAAA